MTRAALSAYLYFGDDCRPAMNYYQELFGGELAIHSYGDFDKTIPMSRRELIMHASLTGGPVTIMACDDPEGKTHGLGNIRLMLSGTDREQLSGWYEKLAADGSVIHALEPQMWGDTYGEVTDRFGMRWMVNISSAE